MNQHANIPIIGQKKFDDTKVLPLGPLKLWPPTGFDQTWILLMAQLASGSKGTVMVLAAVDAALVAFLAEDAGDLGKQGAPVRIKAMPDGQVNVASVVVRNTAGKHDA